MELNDGSSDVDIEKLREKIRKDRPAFPLLQALVLLGAMLGVGAMWYWLRQPPSVAALKSSINQSLQENDWSGSMHRTSTINSSRSSRSTSE